ncbi:MAG: cupin domain-containing protein [Candidatus Omnitrophica bacterium]|nr:cupin domain-containing protein [Candidatus Omnitrophota bacterium]
MAKIESRSFKNPDEVRTFTKGKVELITLGDATIGRATFEPGWRWSTCVKPIANTKSCEAAHFGYQVSGTMRIRMDDGTEVECKAGDVALVPSGHDAWVVGNEPVVIVDFQGMPNYAKEAVTQSVNRGGR